MKWKQIEKIPVIKPKKKGFVAKPQYMEDILILDIYQDQVWESRYCINVKTGEHGWKKDGEGWKKTKLISCIGGDPMGYYCWRQITIELKDLRFDSKREKEEAVRFLGKPRWLCGNYDWNERLECMEMEYDRDKRWHAYQNDAKRKRDLMNQVPDTPEDIQEWIYKKAVQEEYIFFDKRKGKWGCSCCGAEMPDEKMKRLEDSGKVRHNDLTKCPKCGKTLVAKKRTNKIRKRTGLYIIHPINEEASVIRYTDVEFEWAYKRNAVRMEEAIRVVAYKIGVNSRRKHNVRLFYAGWSGFYTGNDRNKRAKQGYLYPGTFKEILDNTVYDKGYRILEQLAATGKELNYNKLLIGIGALKNYENVIEYLLKGRFNRMLIDTVENTDWWNSGTYYGNLNLQGTTLEEVFEIRDRQKINRIRDIDGGENALKWMRYSEETGKKVPQGTLEYMIREEIKPEDLKGKIPDPLSPQQVQNYLEKQKAAGYHYLAPRQILEEWKDYLTMCMAAGKDINDEMVYKPKELKLRHDQAVADANQLRIVKEMMRNKDVRAEEARKMREKYPEAEKNLDAIRERYEYRDEEYIITVPHDLVEIIEDGQALHHCAGASERYFDRIESRETYICFLRKAETPDIPFYTIEVEPSGTIRQHRSYLDEEPGIEEIRGFLRSWQKELKKRLTEEDKRLAKISKVKREQNIKELEEKNNTRVLRGLAEDFMENILDFEEIA